MMSRKRVKRGVAQEEVFDLDVPTSVMNEWDVSRLGRVEDHLWLLSLRTPITVTAAAVAHLYELPFDMAVNKVLLYQTTAAGAADADPLTLRLEWLLPNGAPELYYDRTAAVWPAAGIRLAGRTLLPEATLRVTLSGTNTNLLEISLEVEVIDYGG